MAKRPAASGAAAAVADKPAATKTPARDKRTHAADGLPYPALGAVVIYTLPGGANPELFQNGVRPGDRLPAIVCRILELTPEADTRVNLRVLADGDEGEEGGTIHVANVQRGPGPGRYQPLQATVHQ